MTNPIRPKAFTLIEVIAGLALVGLMAAAAVLSLDSAYRGAQMQDVVARIGTLDDTARRTAEATGGSGTIFIDPEEGRLWFAHTDTPQTFLPPVKLPRGFTVSQVQTGTTLAQGPTVMIACSKHGHTPSYTMTLTSPGGESQRIVFAGLTGQLTLLEHDADFDLYRMQSSRPVTD